MSIVGNALNDEAAMSSADAELPIALTRYLADSEMRVVSWNGTRLPLEIAKEIGQERGLLTFDDVSHVNLAPSFGIEKIRVGGLADLPTDYLQTFRPGDRSLDADDRVYLLDGSWSGGFYVVAKSVAYEITRPSD